MRALRPVALLVASLSFAACSDAPNSPLEASSASAAAERQGFEGIGVLQRYVAIGTSISMGVSSDGVYAASQEMSFPAQLSRLANREMSLPLISFPGCAAPLAAPVPLKLWPAKATSFLLLCAWARSKP